MGAGLEPPKRVFAHGWWTNEGRKISKSLGNVIEPNALIEQYGLDPVRYFLMREVPFGNDGDFSHRAMVGRLNGDLANDLGNLCQRVLSMIAKNCDGMVPDPADRGEAGDDALLGQAAATLGRVRGELDSQTFHNALIAIWEVVGEANRYVDAQAPWTLRKTDPDRMQAVLYTLAETIRRIAIIVQPFMPDAASTILKPGTPLPKPQPVFPRYVEEEEG
jgi:methionyl-tRNA synthetase